MKDSQTTTIKGGHHFIVALTNTNQPLHFWLNIERRREITIWVTDKQGIKDFRDPRRKDMIGWYKKTWKSDGTYLHFDVFPDKNEASLLLVNWSKKPVKVQYLIQWDAEYDRPTHYNNTRFAPSLGGGILGWIVGGPVGGVIGSLLCGGQVRND